MGFDEGSGQALPIAFIAVYLYHSPHLNAIVTQGGEFTGLNNQRGSGPELLQKP